MIKVVTQNHNNEYLISTIKKVANATEGYDIQGYDTASKQYVWLGTYINELVAEKIFAMLIKQQHVQFVGGPYYNIIEMPYDSGEYFIL